MGLAGLAGCPWRERRRESIRITRLCHPRPVATRGSIECASRGRRLCRGRFWLATSVPRRGQPLGVGMSAHVPRPSPGRGGCGVRAVAVRRPSSFHPTQAAAIAKKSSAAAAAAAAATEGGADGAAGGGAKPGAAEPDAAAKQAAIKAAVGAECCGGGLRLARALTVGAQRRTPR